MNPLLDLIDRWKPRRLLVVGDFMLDELLYGNAERLSPDAPVPVLSIERQVANAGGAANVCADLRELRCEVVCAGICGSDSAGDALIRGLEAVGCDTSAMLRCDKRPTTVKRSYVGLAQHRHPQKMFRADFEQTGPLDDGQLESLFSSIESQLDKVDGICIEDYGKGVLAAGLSERVIAAARARGLEVYVDPAAIEDYSRYRGASVMTPNRTEAAKATGLDTSTPQGVRAAARKLIAELDLEAVVITIDREGALLLERGGEPQQVPTEARKVYDVTGAGDMVLAALSAARANGAGWLDSVQLANTAAGLEVEKFGCEPIPLDAILLHIWQNEHHSLGKVRTAELLAPELEAHRRAGRKIAFTNGCFDIVHAGHIEVLRGARATADLLVLAVNSDASIRALKGPKRPIVPETQRIAVLTELECVDYVVLFGDGSGGDIDTPIPLLHSLRPDVLVKGGTYAHDEVVGWEIVESYGGRVETIPPIGGLSTTHIVERIREG